MGRRPLTADERAFGTEVGRVIAEQREKRGMSQQALAEHARLSVDGLRKLETGRVPDPGFRTVLRLARQLDVTLDKLVEQVTSRRVR
ncbi:MAG: helix-turn-helix transcriptional regulator [Chloroflexi bacterium]|nr:helix-turn-helix transcriptional regulator [Chloroflexota bacterium]